MNTTTSVGSTAVSYSGSSHHSSTLSSNAGFVQPNEWYGLGGVARQAFIQLYESMQGWWKKEPSHEEIAFMRQGKIYRDRLTGVVKRLDLAVLTLSLNPGDKGACKKVEMLADELTELVLKLNDRNDLREYQEEQFRSLVSRIVKLNPQLQNRLRPHMPDVFKNIKTPPEKSGEEPIKNSRSVRQIVKEPKNHKRNAPPPADCQQTIDLSNLTPPIGETLVGPNNGLGPTVKLIGNALGDGKEAIAIGIPYASPGGLYSAGQVIIIPGSQNLTSINFSNLTSPVITINGPTANVGVGAVIEPVGDINNDGNMPDVAIAGTNKVWILFAPIQNPTNLSSLGANGFEIQGKGFSDYLGTAVAGGEDYTGDNIDDLLVSAPGADEFYGIFGHSNPWQQQFNLTTQLNGTEGFTAKGPAGSQLGSVLAMGKLNADNLADFSAAAPGASPTGLSNTGTVYTLYGHNGTWTPQLNLTLDGAKGFSAYGLPGDFLCNSMKIEEGANGSTPYLAVGVPGSSPNSNTDAGRIYIVFTLPTPPTGQINLGALNSTDGVILDGLQAGAALGASLDTVDVNNDGSPDLVSGIPGVSPVGVPNGGQVAVYFGQANGIPAQVSIPNLSGPNGFILNGTLTNGNLGTSVANVGNVGGTGVQGFAVSAPNAANATIYIINGWNGAQCPTQPPTTSPSPTGAPTASTTASPTTSSPPTGSPTASTTGSGTSSPTGSTTSPAPTATGTHSPSSGHGTSNAEIEALAISLGVGVPLLLGAITTAIVVACLISKKKGCFAKKGERERSSTGNKEGLFDL